MEKNVPDGSNLRGLIVNVAHAAGVNAKKEDTMNAAASSAIIGRHLNSPKSIKISDFRRDRTFSLIFMNILNIHRNEQIVGQRFGITWYSSGHNRTKFVVETSVKHRWYHRARRFRIYGTNLYG